MPSYYTQQLGFALGIQTKSWQELLAAQMFDETGDKALKSTFGWVPGAGYWNTELIDKLNKLASDSLLTACRW